MFKIKNSTIHCSRGDSGYISLKLPYTDSNEYIQYTDGTNMYWYDEKKKKVYNSNYEEVEKEISTLNIVYYKFVVGNELILNIYERKGYDKEPVKSVEVTITEESEEAVIPLTESDTTFGEIPNKEITYWYDITLNKDKTVVGFDENGEKEFIMYPAKGSEE